VSDGAQKLTTLWLNGMAGTGKTAIASTFARDMEEQGILGATLFIDRQQPEHRDLRRIVQTLAYDLAKHSHEQLRAVWAVLRDDPILERLSYQKQARLLIEKPLDIRFPGTLVVVVDGSDECGVSDGASLLATLVKSLAHHPIKLFVTSRREAHVVDTLRDLPHTSYRLQDVQVSKDVQLYWEHNLDELCRRKCLPNWRSMVKVDQLVELTGHQFTYAATILTIVRNTRSSPIKKLRELVEITRLEGGSTMAFVIPDSHGPLEKLYIHILGEAIKDDEDTMSSEYALRLHDILEVMLLAREPLTPQALSDLLEMDSDVLRAHLFPLSSVLVVPDTSNLDEVIRPLHQSFPDFVRQQGGLVHPQLAIHLTLAEKHATERCLCQLNNPLHFNIGDMKDTSLLNHDILDWKIKLHRISVAFRYSCKYWLTHWLEHLRASGSQAEIPLGLDEFCGQHLPHWIEVLSLTGEINFVQGVMQELISVVNVRFFHSW
jgi:hypothetical protein